MFRSLHIAATGMVAQETQLDSIANNVANANTAGYKRQTAQFEDLLYQNVSTPSPSSGGGSAPAVLQVGAGSRVVSTARAMAEGPVTQTGNPLDIAIEGQGYLAVLQPSGEPAYTRAGNLNLDATGRIVTSGGLAIEPPLTVPSDATSVTIGPDGTVSAQQPNQTSPTRVGQLQLATFPNSAGLVAIGHNLFQPSAASGAAQSGAPGVDGRGTVMQGAIEGSNVEIVDEMIGLISAQRAYEINSKIVAAADQMLDKATQMR